MRAAAFNLLDEPWVPCLLPSGEVCELGLREALRRAPEIVEVVSPSPPVTGSLHRLLLAVLHRVFGPPDGETWGRLWAAGRWPAQPLADYLDRWQDRFDLFSPAHPFGQSPDLPAKLFGPVARLAPELASGVRPAVFDHSLDAQPRAVAAAQAARWLVACQPYCLGGRCGDERGLGTVRAGPLAHAALFLPLGRNLFQTLMLSLLPYAPQAGLPWPEQHADAPGWEQETPPTDGTRAPRGWLDYLTWPSRRLQLGPPRWEGGQWVVDRVAVAPGRALPRDFASRDPMLAYGGADRPTPLPLPAEAEWLPFLGRVLAGRGGEQRPAVLDWIVTQLAWGGLPPGYGCRLTVIGLRAHRAHIEAWAAFRQALTPACLVDHELQADLERGLMTAGAAHRAADFGAGSVRRSWVGLRGAWDRLIHDFPETAAGREARLRWWAGECERVAWRAVEAEGPPRSGSRDAWVRAVRARQQFRAELYGRVLRAYREVGDAAADVPRSAVR